MCMPKQLLNNHVTVRWLWMEYVEALSVISCCETGSRYDHCDWLEASLFVPFTSLRHTLNNAFDPRDENQQKDCVSQ